MQGYGAFEGVMQNWTGQLWNGMQSAENEIRSRIPSLLHDLGSFARGPGHRTVDFD